MKESQPLTSLTTTLWDAIVIGAGPAGATSAFLLAKSGQKVLLIDKKRFPREKVCGCCLSGRAVQTLSELGLAEVLAGAVNCESFVLGANQRQLRLKTSNGLTISRSVLDERLAKRAIEAGATFLQEASATILEHPGNIREVAISQDNQRQTVQGKIVLACGGLAHRILPDARAEKIAQHNKIGFSTILPSSKLYESQTIYMATGPAGYVGLVVLEDGRLNLAAALRSDTIRKNKNLAAIISDLIRSAGFPVPSGIDSTEWTGTPLLSRRRSHVAGERLFILGDAAGYVEPFTGEGMAWAFSSAQAGLPVFLSAIEHWDDKLIEQWEQTYRQAVSQRQWSIGFLKRVMRFPKLISTALVVLRCVPFLATPIIKSIHGEPSEKSYSS
ncbi:NAD(P)/FAD-dependent oxidoreductase [Thalassoglobus polymorphus]|uniref:Oxidoreductase n=1 Tax=Thalassoglobus polymorphus TaxID=2527994 RepID=A0A517QKS8_9PLAN|nr:NAD(P)/FAD-dependent oxidoreductase [Thalassoglobus polymorphus]QDT32245.1 Putative oxidoreductase [Thalassoglobus polymorphus]